MPRTCRLNSILKFKNNFKFDNNEVDALNNSSLIRDSNFSSIKLKQSDEYKISSTIQCRTRAFKTLKHLFNITKIDSEEKRFESERNLFGIPSPEHILERDRFPIDIKNLKQLNKSNSNASHDDLYAKQLRARISILIPQCSPKQVAIILSRFLESHIDALSIEELEYLNNLILESRLNLSSTILYDTCIGNPITDIDNSISSLIMKISRFISSKHPNLSH